MAFVRSWMSDALRAGIAGLAIPVALLAVLGMLALGGAFGGLSSLGQLFVGPQVPLATGGSVPQASPTAGTGAAAAALPAIPRLTPAGQGPQPAGGHAVHRIAVTPLRTPTVTGPVQPVRHTRPTPGRHGSPTPPPAHKGSGSSGGSGPGACGCGQKPQPNPVQQLVTKLQQSVPPTPVPQTPADAIGTIQQLSSSIETSGQKLVSR